MLIKLTRFYDAQVLARKCARCEKQYRIPVNMCVKNKYDCDYHYGNALKKEGGFYKKMFNNVK
jgi:hypothetical protein